MLNPEIVVIPFVFGLPAALIGLRMVLNYRERKEARSALPSSAVADIDARLARLEGAVDTVAIEMERMSEGVRFTTRLLAERGPAGMEARQQERTITPH